jgi:predicted nucleotidyltransferase
MRLEQIIDEAQHDKDIIGLWIGGSQAKGYADEYSDYDVWIFLTEGAYKQRQKDEKPRKVFIDNLEIFYTTIEEVAKFSNLQYAFADAKPTLDKTGELKKLMTTIGAFPKEKKGEIIINELNDYCNALFYSLKAMRRKNLLGSVLEAAQSLEHLLAALFALHERHKPYDSDVSRELQSLTMVKSTGLSERLYRIVTLADEEEQRLLKKEMEEIFRREGYGMVFDIWDQTSTWKSVLEPSSG